MNFFSYFLKIFLVLLFSSPVISISYSNEPTPSNKELQIAIFERLERVAEFAHIKKAAQRMGLKVYLFGGTAAGFAHYAKWDWQRLKGDKRFLPERFDFDYTSIYRSTQDLDIVLDGPKEKVEQLQQDLAHKFPYMQGSKSTWEVRSLREDLGDKEKLLGDTDFKLQHTDSNSTGMIELTAQSAKDCVKDLRDWDNSSPFFLNDVRLGKLHFYFSNKHQNTNRFKIGKNPPIISVVRYFIKAFQYDLKIMPEDKDKIVSIINDFKNDTTQNEYLRSWLNNNGHKLFSHAVDIEYAWNTLEDFGLRKILIEINGNTLENKSLSWWMNKEPLRTSALGTSGKTAKELFGNDLIVAHETSDFLAYESITRSPLGKPNVFISRQNAPDENAVYGNGFYTQKGKSGAAGTGLTIRFELNPMAREGQDFKVHKTYITVTNANALRVIPEGLDLSPIQFFKLLIESEDIHDEDLGLLEKLKRRIKNKMAAKTINKSEIENYLDSVFQSTKKMQEDLPIEALFENDSIIWELDPDKIESWIKTIFKYSGEPYPKSTKPQGLQKVKNEFLYQIYLRSQVLTAQTAEEYIKIFAPPEWKNTNVSRRDTMDDIILTTIDHFFKLKPSIKQIVEIKENGVYLDALLVIIEHAKKQTKNPSDLVELLITFEDGYYRDIDPKLVEMTLEWLPDFLALKPTLADKLKLLKGRHNNNSDLRDYYFIKIRIIQKTFIETAATANEIIELLKVTAGSPKKSIEYNNQIMPYSELAALYFKRFMELGPSPVEKIDFAIQIGEAEILKKISFDSNLKSVSSAKWATFFYNYIDKKRDQEHLRKYLDPFLRSKPNPKQIDIFFTMEPLHIIESFKMIHEPDILEPLYKSEKFQFFIASHYFDIIKHYMNLNPTYEHLINFKNSLLSDEHKIDLIKKSVEKMQTMEQWLNLFALPTFYDDSKRSTKELEKLLNSNLAKKHYLRIGGKLPGPPISGFPQGPSWYQHSWCDQISEKIIKLVKSIKASSSQ